MYFCVCYINVYNSPALCLEKKMAKMLFPDYLTYFFVWVALISVMYYPFVYVTVSSAISLNHGFKMQQRGKKSFF